MIKFIKNIFSTYKAEVSTSDNVAIKNFFSGNASVTASNAQKIPTVFACIEIKAKALAIIPIKTYKITEKGKEEYKTNPLYNILRYEPNNQLVSSLYKKIISQDLDLRGNHYSQIVRNGLGQVTSLIPLHAENMQLIISESGKKLFTYNGKLIQSNKILHIYDIPDHTGHKGLSKIEFARQTLEFANNTSKHGNKLFKNSATPSGAFEMDGILDDEAFKRLKEDLEEKYTGLENAGKPILLEGGLTFKPLQLTNSDSQWLESRKLNIREICDIFGVPSSILNDTENTAYGNLEQRYQSFYSSTIFSLITILEEQLRQSLLTTEEKKNTVIKFKYNTMLRVDTATRANYYQTRFNIGSITPNEIREYEDENKFDGGDEHYVQLNLSTVQNLNKGEPSE